MKEMKAKERLDVRSHVCICRKS